MQLHTKMLLSSLVLGTIMIGCGSSSGDSSGSSSTSGTTQNGNGGTTQQTSRFAPMTMNSETVMQDTTSNLEWVNSAPGCHPMTPGKDAATAMNEAINHCVALNFASHTDWRLPTITEVQDFTVEMQNAGIIPYYQNPACPRLVGFNADKTAIQNTNTHNTPPIGTITDWGNLNAGVRCVRDVTTGM